MVPFKADCRRLASFRFGLDYLERAATEILGFIDVVLLLHLARSAMRQVLVTLLIGHNV